MNHLTARSKSASPIFTGRLTYEQFLAEYPDVYAEFDDGEILTSMTVSRSHSEARQWLAAVLESYVSEKNLGRVYGEPFQMKLDFGQSVKGREPDIFFVSNPRLGLVTEAYLDGPADLAVEIVSKESRRRDRVVKFEEYAKAGVTEYWLIDPEDRKIEFFELTAQGGYRPIGLDSGIYRSRVIDGFWLDPNWLWLEPRPSVLEIARKFGLV